MQRLALAVLAAVLVVGIAAVAFSGLRAAAGVVSERARHSGRSNLRLVAYLLLIALIFYVALSGQV